MSYLKNKTLFLSSFCSSLPLLWTENLFQYILTSSLNCLVRLNIPRDGTSTKPQLKASAYYSKQLPIADGLLTKLRILISRTAAQSTLRKVYMHNVYFWGL